MRLLGLGVICAVAIAYVQPLRSYFDVRDELVRERAARSVLLERQSALERRLAQTDTEEFDLREARRAGLVLPGERLFIVKGVDQWKRARVR